MAGETHPTPDAGYGTELETLPAGVHNGHGDLDVHHAPTHVVRYNPDAPSEEWGWHGEWRDFAPRSEILLWIGVLGLIMLAVFGNQVSHVEDYWLISIAVLMAAWIIWRRVAFKRERRRRP